MISSNKHSVLFILKGIRPMLAYHKLCLRYLWHVAYSLMLGNILLSNNIFVSKLAIGYICSHKEIDYRRPCLRAIGIGLALCTSHVHEEKIVLVNPEEQSNSSVIGI